jgi:hypothetical protein
LNRLDVSLAKIAPCCKDREIKDVYRYAYNEFYFDSLTIVGSFMVGISIRHLKELNFATIVRGYAAIQEMVVILFSAESGPVYMEAGLARPVSGINFSCVYMRKFYPSCWDNFVTLMMF